MADLILMRVRRFEDGKPAPDSILFNVAEPIPAILARFTALIPNKALPALICSLVIMGQIQYDSFCIVFDPIGAPQ